MKSWITDNAQTIKWLVGIVARGIAWILVAKFGLDAAESGVTATGIAEGVAAVVIGVVSTYSSVKGRKTLKAEPPKVKL